MPYLNSYLYLYARVCLNRDVLSLFIVLLLMNRIRLVGELAQLHFIYQQFHIIQISFKKMFIIYFCGKSKLIISKKSIECVEILIESKVSLLF